MSKKCHKCGRKLKSKKSQERGYGPECWKSVSGRSVCKSQNEQIDGQMDINDWIGLVGGEMWDL